MKWLQSQWVSTQALALHVFGIVVTQWQDQQIQIVHAEEYQRPDFNEMLKTVDKLYTKHHPIKKIYIDGANPSFIKSLKIMLGERSSYEVYTLKSTGDT